MSRKPPLETAPLPITIEDIMTRSGDVMFVGSRESGKTTLAHRICILAVEGKADKLRIPAIIDMRRTAHVNDIKKGMHAYLSHEGYNPMAESVNRELHSNFADCQFLVCLDNFDLGKNHHLSSLRKMKELRADIRFVLLCDELASIASGIPKVTQVLSYASIVNIQPLSRKLIRDLSNRKLLARKVSDPDIVESIIRQFNQNDLPRTGYVVTLLLWAWENKLKAERLNEAVLLQAFTDHLLDTADFTGAIRGTFDAKLKMLLLQEIAQRMSATGGIEDSISLQTYLKKFFDTKGLEFNAAVVLEILCNSGILKRSWNDVSFRYRCFQEFFNALYILNNVEVASRVRGPNLLLKNAREIDLLTSLERRARGFDTAVMEALGQIFGIPPTTLCDDATFERINFNRGSIQLAGSRLAFLESLDITQDTLDDLYDEADRKNGSLQATKQKSSPPSEIHGNVQAKEDAAADPTTNINRVSKQLKETDVNAAFELISVLGRVVRNSEFDDLVKKKEMTEAALGSLVHVLEHVIITIESSKERFSRVLSRKNRNGTLNKEIEALLSLCKVIVPGLMSIQFGDDIASPTLFKVFDGIANDVEVATDLRLFACFCLIDIGRSNGFSRLLSLLAKEKSDLRRFMALERLTIRFMTTALPADLRSHYTNTIAEIERGLFRAGIKGSLMKGARIEQLRSQAITSEDD